MIKIINCKKCNKIIEGIEIFFDNATEKYLCEEHYYEEQMEQLKYESEQLRNWLKDTHIKRLFELYSKIGSFAEKIDDDYIVKDLIVFVRQE